MWSPHVGINVFIRRGRDTRVLSTHAQRKGHVRTQRGHGSRPTGLLWSWKEMGRSASDLWSRAGSESIPRWHCRLKDWAVGSGRLEFGF